ncbi:hypothetical protein [Streptomyces sp. MMG1121]|uniref:hypothetical protein n=1 Tax=Streptomyces sp. MMG1121 TaxID=1415544 RepID=UPI0006ADF94D|nr:hypothetical protein [Streptomyces sp. MMG1121]
MSRSHPAIAELHGIWRRALAREADGSTDRVTITTWVQGPSLFGDLRQPPALDGVVGRALLMDLDRPQLLALCGQKAFAGTLEEDGGAFIWVRRIDLHPSSPLPDAGTLHWTDGVLVEEGLHEAYVEHWELLEQGGPAAALLEDPLEGCAGVLVRVGSWFGYARDRPVPLPTLLVPLVEQVGGCSRRAEAATLLDCEVSIGRVHAGRWKIVRSTLPHRVGTQLRPELRPGGDWLRVRDTDRLGRARPRDWQLARAEGPVSLLTSGDAQR